MSLKNLLPVFIALSLFACNNTNEAGDTNAVKKETIDEHAGAEEVHAGKLSLNNGVKWQTDASTRFHAAKLNTTIDVFNKTENANLPAYHAFAAEMQEELGGLVKDCKMKGPDHDALHLWLEPVMKDVSDLKKVSTIDDGKQATERLTEDVREFNQYFEDAD